MPFDRNVSTLRDILRNIELAEHFVAGVDRADFLTDLRTIYAVIRCLEIISEASRRLREDLKERHPTIAWRQMAGAGNIYRHNYEDVIAHQVWDTVQLPLPSLRDAVQDELARHAGKPDP
jgi:uncharacterized protein with HEPN domain